MLKEEQPPTAIEKFVNNILVKLSTAEQLLDNYPSLSQNQTSAYYCKATTPRIC